MKQILIITIILSIGLVSALYGGETLIVDFDFNPVACYNEYNLSYSINQSQVSVVIPINFQGGFNLTCFSNIESDPEIVYVHSGGGSSTRTVYKNNTIYEKIPTYVDKIVNTESIKEVPVEIDKEVSKPFYKNLWFYLTIILLILITIYILWK